MALPPFDAMRRQAMAAVDATFAETVRIAALKDGRVDPNRPAVDLEACLVVRSSTQTNAAGGSTETWKTRFAAAKAVLRIDRTVYPLLDVRMRDKIRALDRPGQPWFEVLGIDDRASGRLILGLGEA